MALENSTTGWGSVSRFFHWGMLALIIVQIPVGLWMVEVYEVYAETYADDTWVMRSSRLHHTLGFLLLGAVILRGSWRLLNPTPGLPSSLTVWQGRLARGNHLLLYALLVIYPLSGWASLSAYEGEFPIFFMTWDSMPRVVPQVAEDAFFNYEFFAVIHRWCWRVGAAVLGLHAGAALWHHFFAHDGVLRRMWSGKPLG